VCTRPIYSFGFHYFNPFDQVSINKNRKNPKHGNKRYDLKIPDLDNTEESEKDDTSVFQKKSISGPEIKENGGEDEFKYI
jgi:hypothetical protein